VKAAAVAIPGAVAGAFISSVIEIEPFKVYFAIPMLFAGIYIVYSGSLKETKKLLPGYDKKLKLCPLFYAGAFSAGIISSLFGVGGGIVFVPLLVFGLGMTLTTASIFMLFLYRQARLWEDRLVQKSRSKGESIT
jgi:uncharacterized membrane protein YfcA